MTKQRKISLIIQRSLKNIFLRHYLTIMFLVILFIVIPWRGRSVLPAGNFPFNLSRQQIAEITLYQNILNSVNPAFSRFYTNKATAIFKNFKINFFESFDLNHYFFANHPLERVGVKETEKLFSWLLPFFIIGLFSLNLKSHKPIILWISIIFLLNSVFSNRYYNFELHLIIPFLFVIGLGIEGVYKKIHEKISK